VDYSHKRNLTITSVILVIGIGGGAVRFALGPDVHFDIEGIALATITGIVLNLVLPHRIDEDAK
jgi:uracil permease